MFGESAEKCPCVLNRIEVNRNKKTFSARELRAPFHVFISPQGLVEKTSAHVADKIPSDL